jgi:hypothetical protein
MFKTFVSLLSEHASYIGLGCLLLQVQILLISYRPRFVEVKVTVAFFVFCMSLNIYCNIMFKACYADISEMCIFVLFYRLFVRVSFFRNIDFHIN